MVLNGEAVTQRCFVKKVALQISENSQEKICNKLTLDPDHEKPEPSKTWVLKNME